jgi:hypothetical protein
MGFWDDVGNAFSSAADAIADVVETVADVVETVINDVGDAVVDVVETIGNGIQDGLNAIGGLLSGIPFIGGFLSGTLAWLGGIVAGVFNLVGAIVKAVFGIIAGVIGGLIKIIGGILTLHGSLILDGLIDIGASITGAVISILGTLASLIQRIIPFINTDRALTKAEKTALKLVFRDSLSLYNIRLKSNNGAGGTFTLDNTIYTNIPNLMVPLHTLVHECTHVWQYQNLGSRYLAEALGAQSVYGRDPNNACVPGNAYDWLGEINRSTTIWEDFNPEAQAQLIEEIWIDGTITTNEVGTTSNTVETGNGAFYKKPLDPEDLHFGLTEEFIANMNPGTETNPLDSTTIVLVHCPRDGNDHTQLAIDSVKTLRGRWNFRLSKFI